ncbi:helix-turn-helix transcriptional regulator [uncultured Dysgonomonas sp.]|uniref:HTH araC/xylS-type domain-containing protein n=1 Tax=uncultured Dysgonomonas sp. TaxID=206096 RepID=A0A212K4M1_9BACT|nr:helix-turn-helix transcriptional regulator [uncultured Dysgonomonas sp.]SBW06661.1 conserved hypothetical protein [uncultured Dysgonomonas sp.]
MESERINKLATLSIDSASEAINYSIIKNYIISDGMIENTIVSFDHPTVVDGIVFVLCIRGEGKIKINTKGYDVGQNMLLTILPGSIFEVVEHSENALFEFLFFSIDFTYDLHVPSDMDIIEKISLYPILQLRDDQFRGLLEFHSFMIKQYKRDNHLYRELLAKNLLSSFLTEMCYIYIESESKGVSITGRKGEIYQQLGKLLLVHIKSERTVQFYADKMCLSAKYLSQLIKEISGRSIMEWINELTIVTIKAMLKTSTMTILQISEELNFPNPSFFGRYFKKHTGMTPLQYRES